MESCKQAELGPASFYGAAQGVHSNVMPGWCQPHVNGTGQSKQAMSKDLSDSPPEDSGSDFDAEQQSDDSDYSGQRKRKRESHSRRPAKRLATPEDNEMRRKLRGKAVIADTENMGQAASANGLPSHNGAMDIDGRKETVSETEDEGSTLTKEEVEDPTAVPERIVSDEQLESERAWLKTSWEFVSILDFLATFLPYLNLGRLQFSAEELESALILNNGTSGLLVDVHLALIKGMSARSGVHAGNWTASLSEKLRYYWRLGPLQGQAPFSPQRRYEAPAYAVLPLAKRVTALRILCELRLEKEDLRNVVELALNPPRKTKAERKAIEKAKQNGEKIPPEEPLPTMEDMRREPLGLDGSGLQYWYLDYHLTTGSRLYREVPPGLWKSKNKKEDGPDWEIIANSPEGLTEIGERLKRSKKAADQHLANLILEELVPEQLQRREADLRKQRLAAKLEAQRQSIVPDLGRTRRTRKRVDYSYDAFDATIRAALRTSDSEPGGRMTRSNTNADSRQETEEEVVRGDRRSRLARAGSPAGELPPFRRKRKAADSCTPSLDQSRDLNSSAEPSGEASSPLERLQSQQNATFAREAVSQPDESTMNGHSEFQNGVHEAAQDLETADGLQTNLPMPEDRPPETLDASVASQQPGWISGVVRDPQDPAIADLPQSKENGAINDHSIGDTAIYQQEPHVLWEGGQLRDQFGNVLPNQSGAMQYTDWQLQL